MGIYICLVRGDSKSTLSKNIKNWLFSSTKYSSVHSKSACNENVGEVFWNCVKLLF